MVSTTGYNERGEANQMTDPKGTLNQLTFDDAGRKTKLLENVSTGAGPDQNRETDYAYNADSRLATLTAQNSTTDEQVTSYTYGTTLTNSDVASNDLLASKTYPDGNSVIYDYNALGELKQLTDQLGTVHVYEYDTLGRLSHDCITTLGTGVDGAVRRISRTYEVRGMLVNLTVADKQQWLTPSHPQHSDNFALHSATAARHSVGWYLANHILSNRNRRHLDLPVSGIPYSVHPG